MKLILISADLEEIRETYDLGVFAGVASNPTLVAEAGIPCAEMVRRVLKVMPDPVFVQVTALDTAGMVDEGRRLAGADPARVRVKVPVTGAGIAAIHRLAEEGVTVTATAICAANEALLASHAGAGFLAPYMARIFDIGGDGCRVVGDIVRLVRDHELPAEVIAASVRTPEELMLAWKVGADYAAIQPPVVRKICTNPAVDAAARTFHADYTARFGAT